MNLLPYEKLQYCTSLNKQEILKRLDQLIEIPGKKGFLSFLDVDTRPYKGSLTANNFKIRRVIHYRNSFQPVITGSIESGTNGTRIMVSMQPQAFALIFMSIWLGIVALVCLLELVMILTVSKGSIGMLIPFAMLFAGYGILIGGFKYEVRKTRTDLSVVFAAEGEVPREKR